MLPLTKLLDFFNHCFQQFHQTKYLVYCMSIFILSFTSYWVLLRVKQRGNLGILRGLFVNAEKSDSNALQIGGIPFSFIALFSIGMLFYWFPYMLSDGQAKILRFATFSWIGILFYGYVDDRYEIRPIVKLGSQFLLVSVFALNASQVVMPQFSALAFVVMVCFSTVVLNGTNLIDGLDSLSFKVSSTIYFGYILLGAYILSLPAFFVATACFFIMLAFYFFNREPSRIHLGEVGVSCLGFSYIVLSTLIYEGYSKFNPPLYAFTKSLLPIVIVLVEVALSFTRRLVNGKSPFRGDKLHVHHILTGIHGLSASNASSVIAGSYFCFLGASFYIMDPFSSLAAFLFLVLFWVSWALLLGRKQWFREEIQLNVAEALLKKEEVKILPSNSLSDFRLIITDSEDKK